MTRFPAIALLLLAAGTAHAADRTLDRSFTVSPGGSLVVNADGASVNVTSTDTDKVSVHMRVSSSEKDLADMTLDATQNGNEITATMRRPKSGGWFNLGSWRAESSIEVTVPRRFDVNVKTGGGSIELRDTAGSVKLNTSGGDITAKNLNGTVWLRTSGGGINVEKVRGDVDANTSGGDIQLFNIDGGIKGHTSGGRARHPRGRQPRHQRDDFGRQCRSDAAAGHQRKCHGVHERWKCQDGHPRHHHGDQGRTPRRNAERRRSAHRVTHLGW